MDYKSYDAYLSVAKSSPKDVYKDHYTAFVDNNFNDATTVKKILHNNKEVKARVVSVFTKEAPVRRMDDHQKIIFNSVDYVINYGDIFEFDNEKWLCMDITTTNIMKSCMVAKCNNTLNVFIGNTLHQIPCVIESAINLHKMGSVGSKYIESPEGVVVVRVGNTDVTRQIKRNNVYK